MAEHIHYSWEEFRQELLADPEAAEAYEAAGRAMALGESVVKLRQRLGWSQKKLAKAAGIRQSVLDGLELGGPVPPYEVLDKVAKALHAKLEMRLMPRDHSGSPPRDRSGVS